MTVIYLKEGDGIFHQEPPKLAFQDESLFYARYNADYLDSIESRYFVVLVASAYASQEESDGFDTPRHLSPENLHTL